MNELRCWTTETATGTRRFHVPVVVRWRDQDAYGHVNNATVFTLLEEARIQAFWKPAESADADQHPLSTTSTGGARTHSLVASHVIEYKAPISHSDHPIEVVLWISHLGSASAELSYEVWNSALEGERILHVQARTMLVFIDAETLRPRRVTDEERQAWTPYMDAPVVLRSDRKTVERFADAQPSEPITQALNLPESAASTGAPQGER